jgi:hypothetical protein
MALNGLHTFKSNGVLTNQNTTIHQSQFFCCSQGVQIVKGRVFSRQSRA